MVANLKADLGDYYKETISNAILHLQWRAFNVMFELSP